MHSDAFDPARKSLIPHQDVACLKFEQRRYIHTRVCDLHQIIFTCVGLCPHPDLRLIWECLNVKSQRHANPSPSPSIAPLRVWPRWSPPSFPCTACQGLFQLSATLTLQVARRGIGSRGAFDFPCSITGNLRDRLCEAQGCPKRAPTSPRVPETWAHDMIPQEQVIGFTPKRFLRLFR